MKQIENDEHIYSGRYPWDTGECYLICKTNEDFLINIDILTNNLTYIRKIAKWSTKDLGDLIGVSKVTISNIENKKVKMSKTQYIALMYVIANEATSKGIFELDAFMNLIYSSYIVNGINDTTKTIVKAFIIGAAEINMEEYLFKKSVHSLVLSYSEPVCTGRTVRERGEVFLKKLQEEKNLQEEKGEK